MARGSKEAGFTQPRAHLIAHHCKLSPNMSPVPPSLEMELLGDFGGCLPACIASHRLFSISRCIIYGPIFSFLPPFLLSIPLFRYVERREEGRCEPTFLSGQKLLPRSLALLSDLPAANQSPVYPLARNV